MAPSVRRGATREKTGSGRKPRRKQHKKRLRVPKKVEIKANAMEDSASNSSISGSSCSSNSCSKSDCVKNDCANAEFVDVTAANACSTPRAQRFRIPEILTCPPAPKKQTVVSNCSLQRRPIAFFAPPDLELFFFLAPRDTYPGLKSLEYEGISSIV